MNKVFRVVRNEATGAWVAAPEFAKTQGKRKGRRAMTGLVMTLATLVSTLSGVASSVAATITIQPGDTAYLSHIYGTGATQTTRLADLIFNGTSTAPATLIVDRNTTLDSDSWLFNATGNAVNQITLSGSRRAVIKLLDGIDMTISKSVGGAVYNSGTASGIVYELGNGSQLRFVDNHANNSYRSLIISNSDVVFRGANGTVVFDNNSAYTYDPAIDTTDADIVFEGNATLTNNVNYGIAGGVMRTHYTGDMIFSGPDATVIIGNNSAISSGGALFSDGNVQFYGNADIYGNRAVKDTAGAIVAQTGLVMETNGTDGIHVHGNYSNRESAGAILIGNGTNYTGKSLLHAKNSDIQFYNNYTQVGNGATPSLTNAVANAINIRQPNGTMNIAAEAGRQVLFRDPITSFNANGTAVNVIVGINTTNGSDITDGKVTFTGEDFTAGSLSTQSRIYANTTVYGGELELKDNAQYGMNTSNTRFTLRDGATLVSTGTVANTVNGLSSGTMTFADGSLIKSRGDSKLNLNAGSRLIGTATGDTVTIETDGDDQLTLGGVLSGPGKLEKAGTGTLSTANANQFLNTGGFNVREGTLNAQNMAQSFSSLDIQKDALMTMGNSGANLTITDRAMIAGALENVQTLNKTGGGDLQIANSVTANRLDMSGGTLKIDAGKTLNIVADGKLGNDVATLVDIASAPALSANTLALLGNNTLDITGYAPRTDENLYTLVHTQNGISGDFSYTVAGQALQDYVDIDHFLIGWARKDEDSKNVIAKFGLVWLNTENASAHGTFNITDGNSFTLGDTLKDNLNTGAFAFGWDGKSLSKMGNGTLIFSAINGYTGSTTVNAGTLRTDIANTLNSSSDIIINNGVLDLNGNDQQVNRLSGSGGTLLLNGATLTAVNDSDNTRFEGDITNGSVAGGHFIKTGEGSLTLAGQTNWTTDTELNAGELILDGVNGGARLTSNIIGASGSSLTLQNGAQLTGWIDPTDVDIDAASRWNMTADSLINSLSNAGTIAISAPTSNDVKTLTVEGDYTGNDGLIAMNTALGGDDSPTDKLTVRGDSVGNTRVTVNNVGGTGAQTVNGIELVQVDGNSAGNFALTTGTVEAGAYVYTLAKGTGGAAKNWYLTSKWAGSVSPQEPKAPVVDPGAADALRPEAGSYISNIAAANTLFSTRLHDRLGEPQYTDALKGEGLAASMWMRHVGGHERSSAGDGQLKTRSNRYVLQLGGDIAQWSTDGTDRWHLGVMGGYANAHSNTRSDRAGYGSDGRISGYSAGLYGTWYQNDADKTGAYVDSWMLYNRFDSRVEADNREGDSYHSKGLTASLEAGYTLKAGEFNGSQGTLNSWYVQPQAQVTWMGVKDSAHTRKDGTRIETQGDGNIQTRLGVRTYLNSHHKMDDGKQREFQPFVEVNWIHNTETFGVKMGGTKVSRDEARNLGEIRTGVEGKVNNRLSVWGNVGVQMGDKGYSDTQGMLGIKYSW
ncbi:autotransporter outer membrane beta-barrel domain-containing protein [Citrobacter farmeri]|nr:autotransporter outer membrane beta-barrel domain-containing protein [Citrobacter farmeri]EKV7296815.1 autotransporter outer membrane beta-barrel domain-containing protein [Citrobacter farmeri]MBJ8745080.1 autotransporter outer membrane beta-barrel domain-containing protein [Citrobacter farmeri]MBJ8758385.1 autotransporter outer membrane beta-barrel domain-containing protein [Citrobacter farmeri]MBJ9016577.1 autotransporter outer membrane beta-barrel domain-containing protein [Citrobacter fa